MYFEWDADKDKLNQQKHGVSFEEAKAAFVDHKRVITRDISHSGVEERYFCFGRVNDRIMTVRFTYRAEKIRIFGAAYWREGVKKYEEKNR
jgi:uncharacterized DUF497 family protein